MQQIKLLPPVPSKSDEFGTQIALDGDYLMVSEPDFDSFRGRVHIYHFDGISWTSMQILEGEDPGDNFGRGLSVDSSVGRIAISHRGTTPGSVRLYELVEGLRWHHRRDLHLPAFGRWLVAGSTD
jgi:hypothetical protein